MILPTMKCNRSVRIPFPFTLLDDSLLDISVGVNHSNLHQMSQHAYVGHVGEYEHNTMNMVEGDQWRNQVSF
jgi:hypothetical protein